MALIYILLFFLATSVDYPRMHVEGRSLNKEAAITTEVNDELTTENALADLVETTIASLTDSINETSTAASSSNNNGITLDISRFTSSPNRSLYDELKAEEEANAVTSDPFFTSSEHETSETFGRLMLDDNETSTEISLENDFKNNESDFKNNATKEERHQIDEVRIDEKTVMYSTRNHSAPVNESDYDSDEATTSPPSTKKGKYLDLMPPGEDNMNMNASLPNAAEVWALAGMREVEQRKQSVNEEKINNDVELLSTHMNNTAKSLLDWTEIAKMENETTTVASLTTAAPIRQQYYHNHRFDDPSTAENKEVAVSTISATIKSTLEDNRIELEHENVEFNANKSQPVVLRIDTEAFSTKSSEENVDVELLPLNNRNDNGKMQKKENLVEKITDYDSTTTTESSEKFTTPLSLLIDENEEEETTTMESVETDVISTTLSSSSDGFTVIGEDDDESGDAGDNIVAKRTITEMPNIKTEEFTTSTTLRTPITTTALPSTIAAATTTFYDIPTTTDEPKVTEKFNRSIMVTKSISMRLATTTEQPDEIDNTTTDNSEVISSTTEKYEEYSETAASSISPSSTPVEITDDDKFKYNTLLPDTTSFINLLDTSRSGKSGGNEVNVTDLSKENLGDEGSSNNVAIISISVSVVVFILLAAGGFLLFKKRKKQLTYGQRCRPVGLDAYSLDNVSVFNSVRRKANALRLSKRSYGNSAFEDPSLQSNVLDYQSLQDFAKKKTSIHDEFKEIPQVTVRVEEVPENCEDKNRYANVVPLPETRVHLQRLNDDEKTEYINANYVKGPKDNTNYYIATQAPLENTVPDFWRMIWEQNSKVIVMITDLTENGVERCAEYIPASVVLDNSSTFGDFIVTLKSREVKGKYAVSQLHLKNLKTNTWREIMHLWYSWPENGCPTDDASVIAMLLEARGYLRTSLPEQLDENSNAENNNNVNDKEKLSTLDKTKSLQRIQGPLTVHCSPGTGRTGTLIACDIVLRMLEIPPRQIDIPQIVYHVRRGRANAVRTKDQYEFIYSIANAYAIKLNTAPAET
ncbi:hypothetical protein PVAND_002116 [Polypedilum vanderplanki]|uniref:Uncharacterized protein n=1 Tax=Polypedilum vanderplanki TaxID=319348 RepID=A0A9J6BQ07_POLVA|nr:hypothetical protein PVAND_002116 [Polypedilum vanderplanki]